MDQLDGIYVVSDLHLGGTSGTQIFKGGHLLAALIQHVVEKPEGRHAFVINGDFIDFLAEPGARAFDPGGAADKLRRISLDPSFSMIWKALGDLVKHEDRELVIVLGNHDLELALPRVQAAFVESVAGKDAAARGRIRFSVTGAGYAAYVGNSRVVCLHGNEVDPFNVTDFEQLRRMVRDQQFGRPPADWVPSAGTKLVIEVMNGIKRDLPFIDLLKPETDAVVPILFALRQVKPDRVLEAMEVAMRVSWSKTRMVSGFLSASEEARTPPTTVDESNESALGAGGTPADAADALMQLLAKAYQVPANTGSEEALAALLDKTEERHRMQVDPLLIAPEELDDRLGGWNLTKAAARAGWSKLIGRTEAETMRAALQHLHSDTSFDEDFEDETFKRIEEIVPVGVQFVVAGHTHLRRDLARSGGGRYLNTGTWARLIQIEPAALQDPTRFAPIYEKLRSSSMDGLDPVVTHLPSVACIEKRNGNVVGQLKHVRSKGSGIELIDPKELRSPVSQQPDDQQASTGEAQATDGGGSG